MKDEPMEMIILIGLQAAGKTTFYRAQFAGTHVLISKDRLGSSKAKNKEQRQREGIETALQEGHSVVIDNTNVTPGERAALIEMGRRHGAAITGYYFVPSIKGSRERNRQRVGKEQVPDKAIFITHARLVPPLYTEGFDSLYYVHVAEHSTADSPKWIVTEEQRETAEK